MEWGVRPISRGAGPESYTIQLPLFLPEFGKFSEIDGADGDVVQFILGGRLATVERKDHFYVVRMGGFDAQAEAEAFLRRMVAGLFLLTIRQRSGLLFDPDPMPVDVEAVKHFRDMFPQERYGDWEKREDGTYTDGGIWPIHTTVYAEHERIVEHQMHWARKVDRLKTKYISETFDLAAEYFDAEAIAGDRRLCLALRLYASAQWQRDMRVGFINQVTVLEVLAGKPRDASTPALEVISELSEVARGAKARYSKSDAAGALAHYELDQLLGKIAELKKKSITASVSDYVYEKLYADSGLVSGDGETSREVSDKRVKEIYGVRSSLVHTGVVKKRKRKTGDDRFDESNNELHQLLPRLLLAELATHAAPGNRPISESLVRRDDS
jgi:hypothetical protein